MSRRNEDVKYLTLNQAFAITLNANQDLVEKQTLDQALLELRRVYTVTPSYVNDGEQVNYEGLTDIQTAAAVVANIALTYLMHVQKINLERAVELIIEARDFQTVAWPSLTEPNRPLEEWILLTFEYEYRTVKIAREPQPNLDRIQKYAAIVANLALWAVQSAKGVDPADDGAEIALIRFFTRFPNGAVSGFGTWQDIANRVRPAGGGFTEVTEG